MNWKDPWLWTTFGIPVAGWLYSSTVQALPDPQTSSPAWYVFFYKWLHALGANWSQFKLGETVQDIAKKP